MSVKTDERWGEWLRVGDAAKYCGLSVQYLYNLASAEAIATYHAGRSLLFKRTELDEHIAKSRRASV